MFIVFEGLDGSGKTTQCLLLAEKIPSVTFNYPSRRGVVGRVIDDYLNNKIELSDRAIHLLFSADRWNTCHQINEKLETGQTVICDRYSHSGIAYSTAKGLPYEWCDNTEKGLPYPDIVIFLKTENVCEGTEKYETISFQKKVAEAYKKIVDRVPLGCLWLEINNLGRTPEDIHEEIYAKVKLLL